MGGSLRGMADALRDLSRSRDYVVQAALCGVLQLYATSLTQGAGIALPGVTDTIFHAQGMGSAETRWLGFGVMVKCCFAVSAVTFAALAGLGQAGAAIPATLLPFPVPFLHAVLMAIAGSACIGFVGVALQLCCAHVPHVSEAVAAAVLRPCAARLRGGRCSCAAPMSRTSPRRSLQLCCAHVPHVSEAVARSLQLCCAHVPHVSEAVAGGLVELAGQVSAVAIAQASADAGFWVAAGAAAVSAVLYIGAFRDPPDSDYVARGDDDGNDDLPRPAKPTK
eukprot:gene20439-62165_t